MPVVCCMLQIYYSKQIEVKRCVCYQFLSLHLSELLESCEKQQDLASSVPRWITWLQSTTSIDLALCLDQFPVNKPNEATIRFCSWLASQLSPDTLSPYTARSIFTSYDSSLGFPPCKALHIHNLMHTNIYCNTQDVGRHPHIKRTFSVPKH